MDLRRHTERRVYLLETEDYGWEIIDPIHPDLIPEPQVEDVLKHGTHDQKTHGNWATGVSLDPSVASSILERVRENGGLSVNMIDGSEPKTGYMVAKDSKLGQIASAEDFYDSEKGPKILADYMKKNRADLATGKNYLGLWHNTADGQVYLDISENISDRETARTLGAKRDQISIWDVANFAEIDTGGTGNVGKNRSYQTSRYITDERRANRQLRSGVVGKDSKAYEVIYFEAGLKPILKHQEHDQSKHGNWARGVSDISSLGPSLEDLDAMLNSSLTSSNAGIDDLRLIVENDRGMYEAATEDIDFRVEERLARLQAEFPLHEYTEQEKATIYEDIQREMIDAYIDENSDDLHDIFGSAGDVSGLEDSLSEIYNTSHDVLNKKGEKVTSMDSVVRDVKIYDGYREGIAVGGNIVDLKNDTNAGDFVRTFYKEGNTWMVEHDLFILQEDYRSLGFGKDFIERQEEWYVSKGFGAITLGTALDGARHWARAGFDFDPEKVDVNLETISRRVENTLTNSSDFSLGSPARAQFDSLMERATNGYVSDEYGIKWTSVKKMNTENFPTPNDFAMIGYNARTETSYISPITGDSKRQHSWAGERMMDGLNLRYVKVLTPEGRSILQGPIDRDGDGMVFDGTARERPAPLTLPFDQKG